ncbi:hypothetical protein P4388_29590 [Bacillus thuringiensis]|uniref:hypothetical protein n=1 Tax=Bacillus thuringiensis TaxID=1428 RepID=UPI000B717A72|nr:hypothetical protein [Bacillus thuringiensis]MEB8652338.1 hypothetical protein [Bacillus cereus]MEB8670411.1 hypothetical protein [Bacillus cereus]MED3352696.1 hypothetical protein [Bacillus thuringiensis]OTW75919.1 hypothetical protein BK710_29550 [Bacillus thuringiensis serovar sumiyoshiensis]OTX09201.1 hypothetical protein BK711_01065 [Bacillus thuringiensis serovar fukuokaensis]
MIEESLMKVSLAIMKTKSIIFFIVTSVVFFLTATYFYNKKFPNHKYPELVEFLKYIS